MGLTVRGLFWNPGERRLRAPWRLGAALSLLLLAAVVAATAVRALLAVVDPAGAGWIVAVAAAFLGLSWAVVGTGRLVDRRPARDLGLGFSRRWWADAAAGLGIGVAMAATVVALAVAAGAAVLGPIQGRPATLTVAGVGPVGATLLWLLFFLGAAVLEEVFVRGYLLVNAAEGLAGRLGRRRATLAALGLTAALFGALHAANPGGTLLGLLNVTLAGLLLGGAYVLTDRLALSIGIHVAWNVAVGPVFGLPVSGLTTSSALFAVEPGSGPLAGGAFGPEGGLGMLAGLAVGAGLLAWWLRDREGLALRTGVAEPDLRGSPAADSKAAPAPTPEGADATDGDRDR